MKRTAALIASVALTLALAACGSSSSDSSSSSEVVASSSASESAATASADPSSTLVETPDRDALIEELRTDGKASGATDEQIDCVVDAISDLDAGQLQSIKDGTPDADTQAVMAAASEKCLPTASPAAS